MRFGDIEKWTPSSLTNQQAWAASVRGFMLASGKWLPRENPSNRQTKIQMQKQFDFEKNCSRNVIAIVMFLMAVMIFNRVLQ